MMESVDGAERGFVTSVAALGLHNVYDIECEFSDGVNVVYGENGTGKTTLLHIIANCLNGDYERFLYIQFASVELTFSNGASLQIRKHRKEHSDGHFHTVITVNDQEVVDHCSRLSRHGTHEQVEHRLAARRARAMSQERHLRRSSSVAYFPAFRTAIDAWAASHEEPRQIRQIPDKRRHDKTEFARHLFGRFVPRLDYPATSEIEATLNDRIRFAIAEVSRADRQYFGEVPSRILDAFRLSWETAADPGQVLADIEALSRRFQEYPIYVEATWARLHDSVKSLSQDQENARVAAIVLSVYRDALRSIVRVQENAFHRIQRYLETVNSFLTGKYLKIGTAARHQRDVPAIQLQFAHDREQVVELHSALSSGERQILTLIYASTVMTAEQVILVDEPEISLHVDWQRKLLPAMVNQMPSKQFIVCTHSPIIGAKYKDKMQELRPTQSGTPDFTEEFDLFEDGD